MATAPESAFDDLADAFADYGTSLAGYIRYQLSQRNLEPFVVKTKKPLRVLDVGGGSGGDSAWLAGFGHHVTYIEPSVVQRRYAERRFNFLLEDDARKNITIVGSTLDDLKADDNQFDLMLVHAVGPYQADPAAFIASALPHVKPGGLVSIIEKGYYGTEVRDLRNQNFTDLAKLHKTGRSINNLKQNVYAFKPDELEELLVSAGFSIVEWSGIRLVTDDFDMPVSRIDPKQLETILQVEYEHGHHPAIRGQGQLLHFIARKR